jgi:hypothetical protein
MSRAPIIGLAALALIAVVATTLGQVAKIRQVFEL